MLNCVFVTSSFPLNNHLVASIAAKPQALAKELVHKLTAKLGGLLSEKLISYLTPALVDTLAFRFAFHPTCLFSILR